MHKSKVSESYQLSITIYNRKTAIFRFEQKSDKLDKYKWDKLFAASSYYVIET